MTLSQNDMGRAFEHAIALNLSTYLPAPITESIRTQKAQACFALARPTVITSASNTRKGGVTWQENLWLMVTNMRTRVPK